MAWAKPPICTGGALDRAGKAVALGAATPEQWDVVDAWRMSHAFPLNTFQVTLRQRARRVQCTPAVIVGQRLKRFRSIQGKLEREPKMALSQMQDIGGCRAVVSNVEAVRALERIYVDAGCRVTRDYIQDPKPDGYRSVHIVGRYQSDSEKHAVWNGKRIEVQLRTNLQHIFATAMETAGTFTGMPLKFGGGDPVWRRFFALVGGLFATMEDTAPVPGVPAGRTDIASELRDVANQLQAAKKLRAWRKITVEQPERRPNSKLFVLVLNPNEGKLHIHSFISSRKAADFLRTWELWIQQAESNVDAVMVRAESLSELRRAFPNYHADTDRFLEILESAIA